MSRPRHPALSLVAVLLPVCGLLASGCLELKESAELRADSVAAARAADSIRIDSALRSSRPGSTVTGTTVPVTRRATPPAATPEPVIGLDFTPGNGNPQATTSELLTLRGSLQSPLPGTDLSKLRSNFDEVRGGGSRRHEALDILVPRGTPIRSAASGRLLRMFTSKAGGLMVYASDSTQKFILMYAHLDGYAAGLQEGMPLQRGDVLGYVGTTGNAPPDTPHLHFAIARVGDVKRWWDGTPVDPLPLLR